jgi:hypothetical protein
MRDSLLCTLPLLVILGAAATTAYGQQTDPARPAQAPPPVEETQPSQRPAPQPSTHAPSDRKSRVYITESQS